ncbi:26S proteasome regulatory subunit 8 homolog A-like isoform X3 [Zingiber officinale]|nr:26S proteasome regulatory subunit 8 homolog A-like isoform X3 [Zingiber officinale]
MASAVVEKKQPVEVEGEMCAPTTQVRGGGGKGLRQYYVQYIHDLQLQIRKKANNLQRLEAQRNDLNSRVRMLREELQLLQKPSSYVGEVVKVMGKSKVLVKHWYYIFLRFKKGRYIAFSSADCFCSGYSATIFFLTNCHLQASGPMYCYKDGKLTALEEANQPDGIYVHEKCVV